MAADQEYIIQLESILGYVFIIESVTSLMLTLDWSVCRPNALKMEGSYTIMLLSENLFVYVNLCLCLLILTNVCDFYVKKCLCLYM